MASSLTEEQIQKEKRLQELAEQELPLNDSMLREISEIIDPYQIEDFCLKEGENPNQQASSAVKEDQLQPNASPDSDIRQYLMKATLPQKIKLALLGNATCRGLLIRDSNKMIQQCILKNPRLQGSEIEAFGKNPNLSEFILRTIASNTQWMRSYGLKYALIFNPKTPQDVSMKWVKFLNASDLRKLAKSKNVPSVVNIAARKRLADSQQG